MFKKVIDLIQKSNSIAILSHVNPDADTIGSMLGLYIALKTLKKKIYLFNTADKIDKKYDFLPMLSKIKNSLPDRYDLIITVDCANLERTGVNIKNLPIINFDHHKTNTLFGDINIIRENFASTSMIIYEFIQNSNLRISPECATCLYAALADDSGFFQYKRVDKKTFEIAKNLVEYGAKPPKIASFLNQRNSLAKIRLMQLYINSIELKKDAMICISKLTVEDYEKTGATLSDSDTFVQIGLSLATVKLSIFIYEINSEKAKFSLRSKDNIDCSSIALLYKGGGHSNAAGFTANIKDIDDIIENILKKVSL